MASRLEAAEGKVIFVGRRRPRKKKDREMTELHSLIIITALQVAVSLAELVRVLFNR